MTREEMIYVLQNVKYDAKGYCTNVEYRDKDDSEWRKTASPVWDFDCFDYRIKPETKRVPLTMQDLIDRELSGETMRLSNGDLILSWNDKQIKTLNHHTGYDYLLNHNRTFLDGTPCYKEVGCE